MTGQIDFKDSDIKGFVLCFIGENKLKNSLRKKKQKTSEQAAIVENFNMVKTTYGSKSEAEIEEDLRFLFLILCKRYKPMGKSFCAYVIKCYKYEVARFIKKFIKNPINVNYKIVDYELLKDTFRNIKDETINFDSYYEQETGLPDLNWISGKDCSEEFKCLTMLERKILIKYYLEKNTDGMIADDFGMAIADVNTMRREATIKVAKSLNIDQSKIRRSRNTIQKSGKNLSRKN